MEPVETARAEAPAVKKDETAAQAPKAAKKAPAQAAPRVSGSAVTSDSRRKEPSLTLKSH
jgi:hypothetical protein